MGARCEFQQEFHSPYSVKPGDVQKVLCVLREILRAPLWLNNLCLNRKGSLITLKGKQRRRGDREENISGQIRFVRSYAHFHSR